jgi:hypothetical protein
MNQEEPLSRWVVLLIGFFFGALAGLIAASNLGAAEPTVIFEDSFERTIDDWPAPWKIRGMCGYRYTWAPVDCRASDGNRAVWCAVTQSDFGNIANYPCAEKYPNDVCAMLLYGPFPADTLAWVEFDYWVRCEERFDFFAVAWSPDGSAFRDLESFSGDMGDQWHTMEYYIPPVDSAYIAFYFRSDPHVNRPDETPNGAFIDNVRIYSVGDDQDPVDDPPEDPVDDEVDNTADSLRAVIEQMREVICNE